ncbi:hypothetical protein KBC04_04040 [Candidatus Babeliales bacterium]|nr:hypothetical protein [Candidatus Babeliales bacterium]MBP9843333.1 hypothetical protein [Candidatus Babeliales bacterium]
MIVQTPSKNQNNNQKFSHNFLTTLDHNPYQSIQQNLEALFNPFIRVVPEKDWSEIKAIWIPFLHHDYKNELQKSEKIMILQPSVDKFGSIQGYLLARNENYIPYLTTFFSPQLTQFEVIELILQAQQTILETQLIVSNVEDQAVIRKSVIGAAKSGMLITITTDKHDKIIDAFPLFNHEQL